MADYVKALALIKQHGVFGLGGDDGCLCTSFAVQGVNVEISCRKSSGSPRGARLATLVRVTCSWMGTMPEDLAPIAREVAEQVYKYESIATFVRYCDYQNDHPARCVYCGKLRQNEAAYLCDKCQNGVSVWKESIAKQYDFRPVEFMLGAYEKE